MHDSVRRFAESVLDPEWVRGRHVLEVGAYDVNGSLRPMVTAMGPASYTGLDTRLGPGVDVVLAAEDMDFRGRYDLLICTEMLEHAEHWRSAVIAMKWAVAVGGRILLTCRGPGAARHAFPDDFWRFTPADLARAFSDFDPLVLVADPDSPGSFLYAERRSVTVQWPVDDVEAAPE